jgi:protein phosphatase
MWRVLFHFSDKGPRAENQDAIFCWSTPDGMKVIAVLCDGVGGSPCGSKASVFVANGLGKSLQNAIEKTPIPNEKLLSELIYKTQSQLQEEVLRQPSCEGMATTLAALVSAESSGVWHIHAGDSRLYQIRNGRILHQTQDHTPVNELLRQGIITPEEAAASPRSSRISRAIKTGGPASPPPEIGFWNTMQAGDLFFLCSDGVWAYVDESDWLFSLNKALIAPESAAEDLFNLCAAQSRDNFSAILLTLQTAPLS